MNPCLSSKKQVMFNSGCAGEGFWLYDRFGIWRRCFAFSPFPSWFWLDYITRIRIWADGFLWNRRTALLFLIRLIWGNFPESSAPWNDGFLDRVDNTLGSILISGETLGATGKVSFASVYQNKWILSLWWGIICGRCLTLDPRNLSQISDLISPLDWRLRGIIFKKRTRRVCPTVQFLPVWIQEGLCSSSVEQSEPGGPAGQVNPCHL